MPGRRRGRGSSGARKIRQRTEWVSTTLSEQQNAAGADSVVDLLSGLTVSDKQRVDRIVRCIMVFRYHQLTANSEVHGRIGMHVVTDDALTAGAVPDPAEDFRSAWYYNEQYAADRAEVGYPEVIRYDTRTQRKIPSLSTLAWMIETNSLSAGSVVWYLGVRLLFAVK